MNEIKADEMMRRSEIQYSVLEALKEWDFKMDEVRVEYLNTVKEVLPGGESLWHDGIVCNLVGDVIADWTMPDWYPAGCDFNWTGL